MLLIWLAWYDNGGGSPCDLWRWFAITSIIALSLAHANLLLLLAGRRRRVVRIALAVTLAAIAVVALLLVLPLLSEREIPGADGGAYSRTFGVIAIIDALGTVVLPVVALLVESSRSRARTRPRERRMVPTLRASMGAWPRHPLPTPSSGASPG